MDKITEQLWISDIRDVETKSTKRFDRVVTICQDNVGDNVGCAYNYFPLSDGPPHPNAHNPGRLDYRLFESAVDTIINAVEEGETVLCHCHAGQSRSVMACTAALSVTEGLSFDKAFWKVRAARGEVNPSNELYLYGTRYTNRHDKAGKNDNKTGK